MYSTKLGSKIVLLTVSLTMLALTIVAGVFLVVEKNKINEYHLTNGKTFAEFITPSIYENYVSSPTNGQLSFLDLILSKLSKNPDITNVMMVSKAGKVFFDTADSRKGIEVGRNATSDRYISDEITLQMVAIDSVTHRPTELEDGTSAIEIIVPVAEASGVHIFSMRYLLSFGSINEQFYAIYRDIGLTVIPIIAIIIFSTILFSRSLVKPLKELTLATEEIKRGNLDVTITSKSTDEIGLLSAAFDVMAKELKRSRAEIMTYSKSIEKKVEERTFELNEKVDELGRMNKLMVDRELKMIELKKEIEVLKSKSSVQSP